MIKGNKDYGYEYIGYQATQHVVCINNTDSIIETWLQIPIDGGRGYSPRYLEIGKTYVVIREDGTMYDNKLVLSVLIDGIGWFYKERFLTIEEWRNNQLNKIGI